MKNYRILSIIRNLEGRNHRYDLNRISGVYVCPTLNNGDKKTETDFICCPNSHINSIENITGIAPHNGAYDIGTRVVGGTITGFYLNNSKAGVILDYERQVPFLEVRRIPIPKAINNENNMANTTKTVKTAPSRSTAKAAAAPKLAVQNPFEELETKILKLTPIRLAKFFKKNLPDTLEEFLQNFFVTYNNEHPTIYVESKKEQTSVGRRRSLGDIFLICKYYYPSCNLNDVVKILFKTFPTKLKGFRSSYCYTINKRVFYYAQRAGALFQENTDEYGKTNEFYTSKLK